MKKYKIGDFVSISLGLNHDRAEIVEIVDEEYIAEIDAHDYFIQTKSGFFYGPYKPHSFTSVENPNSIIKDLL